MLNRVEVEGARKAYEDPLYSLVRQKPNRRLLGIFRYHMWRYVVADVTQRNLLERSGGQVNGEPPVVLDTNLHALTAERMEDFLLNKGYLNSKVHYRIENAYGLDFWRLLLYQTIKPNRFTVNRYYNRYKAYKLSAGRARRRAKVVYQVDMKARYRIRQVRYFIADRTLDSLVRAHQKNSFLDTGAFYDSENLKLERNRVARVLRRNGYYNFNKEYLYFDVDTSTGSQRVDVGLRINNPSDSTRHQQARIDRIMVRSNPDFFVPTVRDTVIRGVSFRQGPQPIQPKALREFIVMHPDTLYDEQDIQNTIQRLSSLEVLRFVDLELIQPRQINDHTTVYDVVITLVPEKNKLISWEAEATSSEVGNQANTQGRFYGIGTSINFSNQNFVRKAWRYKLRLSGAIEYGSDTLGNLRLEDLSGLRLNEANVRANLSQSVTIPKLLFLHALDQGREINETSINMAGTLERSIQFDIRRSLDLSYQYIINNELNTNFITPIQITLVSTENSDDFQQLLDDTSSELSPSVRRFFNTNRYVFTFSRYSFSYDGQAIARGGPYWSISYTPLESSGSLLHWFEQAFPNSGRQDTLFGVPYFRYLKTDLDVRRYYPSGKNSQWAFRLSLGYARPLPLSGGESTLPFEKRYFIGGSNSIRAWRARSLGPGQYEDPQFTGINQSGDFRLLANAEYRFPIVDFIRGALFLDAGNIWQNRLNVAQSQELATINEPIRLKEFAEEIALGTGVGMRFDADFFIFRLDLGLRLHDPANAQQENQSRWIIQDFNWSGWTNENARLNIGIGYPF